jgi:thiamine-phosphate pyrophosphorylase
VDEPVDYVSAGPVTATPTKPGRPGTGADYVAYAVRTAGRPVFVTGGVSPDTVRPLLAAGARHFVVVRWLTEAADPEDAARALRAALG